MVKINGEEENVGGMTVEAYITSKGYDRTRIAVEINMDILPKCEYGSRILKDGDMVEVVSFVGGG
ncbi:MAG: sulfur carrier protein ThiS [Butyrivibrio sp.]|nr:sulfur carrier protein ThiS [Butyrivibrio sp.]